MFPYARANLANRKHDQVIGKQTQRQVDGFGTSAESMVSAPAPLRTLGWCVESQGKRRNETEELEIYLVDVRGWPPVTAGV